MSNKLSQDASASAKGQLYQYYVALKKAFELKENQSLYIEKYGDITIKNAVQIETKRYSDSLTDLHPNFWNTLKNWMNDDFKHQSYEKLILLTTQDYGENTKLKDWNNKTPEEKMQTLVNIQNANPSPSPKIKSFFDIIFNKSKMDSLKAILRKFVIVTSSQDSIEYFDSIKNQYAKGIPENLQNNFLNALLGFIICPDIVEGNGWEITYCDFKKCCESLTEQYCSGSKIFPQTYSIQNMPDSEKEKYSTYLFITKIEDIEYKEVISEAMSHYWQTQNTIIDDLKKRCVPKSHFDTYEENLLNNYRPEFSIAKRNAEPEKIIKHSQNFYDTIMKAPAPNFANFNDTPIYFKNGILHILADDEKKDIKWKLGEDSVE